MNELKKIVDTISQILPELESKFYVEHIGVFGSYAKGKQSDDSDLDFVIKFRDDCPDLYENKYYLREYLKKIFGKNIDIANRDYLKPYIWDQIKSELLYVG